MNVEVEKLGPCLARVSFSVPGEEFEREVQKALKRAGKNVRAKGFRAGKVPVSMLEKAYGEQVREEAKEFFLQRAYREAVENEGLKPVGFERGDTAEKSQDEQGVYAHEFEVSLRPEFELDNYKGLEIRSELTPVDDGEIDAALEDVRIREAHPEPAGEDGLPEDGVAMCKLVWRVGDEEILDREELRLSPQTVPPGVEAETFTAALTGAKEDESFELPLTVPEDFHEEDKRGKEGTCLVTVTKAFRMVPPDEAEIREKLGIGEAEDLRAEVKARIEKVKALQEDRRREEVLLDSILEDHPMELPEKMLEHQTQARLGEMRSELMQQGIPEEEAEKHLTDNVDAARERARRGMQALFVIQAIAEKEELLVTQEEMAEELKNIAKRNDASLEEVAKYYRENNLIDQMALEILERKVRNFLRESATITEPN